MASGSDNEETLPNRQSTSDVVEREFVLKLIALYKENPLLWNAKDDHYTNKYRRIVALQKICESLKQYKPDYNVDELKKKLNILRTNFNKERNKIELRHSRSPNEEIRPTLWYYNEMAFLLDQEVPPKKTILKNEPQQLPSHIRLRNLKRKKISIITDPLSLNKKETEEDILAKCWAIKLKKLTPEQRLYAEKIINDTLFEAELGTLTRHGASFNANPVVWSQFSTETQSPTLPT